MISRTRLLAMGLATAGLVTLQVGTSAQGTTSTSPTQTYGQSETQKKSPRYHLDQAKRVLNEIERSVGVSGSETSSTTTGATSGTATGTTGGTTGGTTTGTTGGTTGTTTGGTMTGQTSMSGQSGDLKTTVKELRKHFNELESAYERSSGGAGTGTSGTTGTTGTAGQAASGESWMTHYSRLNQVLDRLNVPKTSSSTEMGGTTSGTTGTGTTGTGTTGSGTTTGSTQAGGTSSQAIDPSMMSKLREFRMHIDNFHTAAMEEGRK